MKGCDDMKILNFADLKRLKGVPWSRVHIARLERVGRFPRHFDIGKNSVAWSESEVDDFIAERIAARDAKHVRPDAEAA